LTVVVLPPGSWRFFHAKLHRDGVGGLEADATDVTGQPVGVFRHDLDGIGAVGLVDTDRPGRADPMASPVLADEASRYAPQQLPSCAGVP
jgi:hypothetical protein